MSLAAPVLDDEAPRKARSLWLALFYCNITSGEPFYGFLLYIVTKSIMGIANGISMLELHFPSLKPRSLTA